MLHILVLSAAWKKQQWDYSFGKNKNAFSLFSFHELLKELLSHLQISLIVFLWLYLNSKNLHTITAQLDRQIDR